MHRVRRSVTRNIASFTSHPAERMVSPPLKAQVLPLDVNRNPRNASAGLNVPLGQILLRATIQKFD